MASTVVSSERGGQLVGSCPLRSPLVPLQLATLLTRGRMCIHSNDQTTLTTEATDRFHPHTPQPTLTD